MHVPILALSNPANQPTVGKAQVTYLVEQGQPYIVFAAPERADVQRLSQARLEGVRQRCAECGLEPPLVQVVPATLEGARAAIVNLLSQQPLPFGVCCYNDEVAFAVIAALSDAGIHVPGAVAVIGCDDIPLAQFCHPPLTTIRFDDRQAFDLLVENILAASSGEPIETVPSTSLSVIVRQSV